jgi:hypothetical protein
MVDESTKEKKRKQKPTMRQREAVRNYVENRGNASKAMRDAHYSPATAKNPKNLTESAVFKELLDEFIPDKKLLQVGKDGLNATVKKPRIIGRDSKGNPEYEYVSEKDHVTRHKYYVTGLQLKGHLKQGGTNVMVPVQVNIDEDRSRFA